MLQALRIANFAVIEEEEISFEGGLTVLTGETGAGKSILVDALGLLTGGRADPDVIRAGASEATVEAVFTRTARLADRLAAQGLPDQGETVSIRRVVGASGRGRAYVNGSLVAVGALSQLMKGLVDIAGQHEHVGLFDAATHRVLLDRLGNLEPEVERYRRAYEVVRERDAAIAALGGDEEQLQSRAEFLKFQLDEIAELSPELGELSSLEEQRKRLASTEKLKNTASSVEGLLVHCDGSALELLGRGFAQLESASRLDSTLVDSAQAIARARAEVDEVARSLSRYAGSLEGDAGRLAEVDDRLNALKRLCRKHVGANVTDPIAVLLEKRTALVAELDQLANRKERLEQATREREAALKQAMALAEALSKDRSKAAASFSARVLDGLEHLSMGRSTFEVHLVRAPELSASGIDEVEFFFSANPGEPVKPLAKVASGGEASRVLLALKRALARCDDCDCYVLDEVDSGVGGAIADGVGRVIKEVSGTRQVLCITHLPQVAAYADTHLLIEKTQGRGKTRSRVEPLEDGDRARELARMLSGLEVTREALGAAQALMRSAKAARSTRTAAKKPVARAAAEQRRSA